MENSNLEIIFEDRNIIVANKPQGVPVQSDKTNSEDMLTMLANQTNSEVYLVHRLDRPVGGIMVFAKNKQSCACLSEQVQNKTFKKKYTAVVCGEPKDTPKTLVDYMIKNERLNLSKIVNKNMRGAKMAELTYSVIETAKSPDTKDDLLSLVEIDLKTGRHHQIRLQMSNKGFPLWGDTKYNKSFKHRGGFTKIALYSTSIEFKNPTTHKIEKYTIALPETYPFNIFSKRP